MNESSITEGFLFPMDEEEAQRRKQQREQEKLVPLTKYGKPDHRCKPNIHEPRPDLTMEEMRAYLSGIKELTTATGIRYINLRLTAKMVIGIRETSGKEFTINLDDLYRAYQECLRFSSPEVKKYIFMGHSPAVALLRILSKKQATE